MIRPPYFATVHSVLITRRLSVCAENEKSRAFGLSHRGAFNGPTHLARSTHTLELKVLIN